MIWLDVALAAVDRVAIPLADPFLAHGLGLFETFRTWRGVAPLLGRHLARLDASARAVRAGLERFDGADPVRVVFTAHSIPIAADERVGDRLYSRQVAAAAAATAGSKPETTRARRPTNGRSP